MEKSADINPELLEFRRQIDALDEKLIQLLIERINIVGKVGKLKHLTHPGQCAIRAGREADMVRGIVQKLKNTPFSSAAGAAIWRILIGASTTVENPLSISAYAPDSDPSLYWLAREYFGPFIPVTKQAHVKRVIGDVLDGKTAIGIVPNPRSGDENQWWSSLIQQGNDSPKIFAHIPFVHYGSQGKDAHTGLAISKIQPEPSADDISMLVFEADHNVSQNRLQTASAAAKLDAQWLSVTSITPSVRLHLVECKGFITPAHEKIAQMHNNLASSAIKVHFLGAYATPFIIDSDNHIKHDGRHAK